MNKCVACIEDAIFFLIGGEVFFIGSSGDEHSIGLTSTGLKNVDMISAVSGSLVCVKKAEISSSTCKRVVPGAENIVFLTGDDMVYSQGGKLFLSNSNQLHTLATMTFQCDMHGNVIINSEETVMVGDSITSPLSTPLDTFCKNIHSVCVSEKHLCVINYKGHVCVYKWNGEKYIRTERICSGVECSDLVDDTRVDGLYINSEGYVCKKGGIYTINVRGCKRDFDLSYDPPLHVIAMEKFVFIFRDRMKCVVRTKYNYIDLIDASLSIS